MDQFYPFTGRVYDEETQKNLICRNNIANIIDILLLIIRHCLLDVIHFQAEMIHDPFWRAFAQIISPRKLDHYAAMTDISGNTVCNWAHIPLHDIRKSQDFRIEFQRSFDAAIRIFTWSICFIP